MKNVMMILVSMLIAGQVSARSPMNKSKDFFECAQPGADENRIGIDLKKKIAAYFDNDTTSVLKMVGKPTINSMNGHEILMFEGKDKGAPGLLRVVFNKTQSKVSLMSITNRMTDVIFVGAKCKNAVPWDL